MGIGGATIRPHKAGSWVSSSRISSSRTSASSLIWGSMNAEQRHAFLDDTFNPAPTHLLGDVAPGKVRVWGHDE